MEFKIESKLFLKKFINITRPNHRRKFLIVNIIVKSNGLSKILRFLILHLCFFIQRWNNS